MTAGEGRDVFPVRCPICGDEMPALQWPACRECMGDR